MTTKKILMIVVFSIASWSSLQGGQADGINLSVTKGPGTEEVTLSWTGGLPLFQVYRSTQPNDVELPDKLRAETNSASAVDTTPPGTGIFFYRIKEYCPDGNCPLTEIPAPAPAEPCEGCGGPDRLNPALHSTYLFSGEFYLPVEDLRIKGRGLDFVWSRKYRSRFTSLTAMGHAWDYSYNLRIEANGPDRIVHDGNTRSDLYLAQPDGTWARRELFRVLSLQVDGSYSLMFSDTSRWNFTALDGSPAQGRITSSVDRNGNALSFAYDGSGRLSSITDTLGRLITVQYDGNGFIQSVTDFTGRQVRYEHYQSGDLDGSPGDLKSVTTPTVIGTPNGNDFPAGKTTLYTFTTGQLHPLLNHNLLTITDPKGQTYLQNVYAPTLNPGDPGFDHLDRQIWGYPGEIVDVVYAPQTPTLANNFARNKAIVNDRVGNVREYLYDSRNRLVMQLDYTGRADPDLPTTETTNRPTGKLRPDDPDSFETKYSYNDDSLVTQIVHPNGNKTSRVHELDLDPLAPRRARGNLRQLIRSSGPLGGDQGQIVEQFEYDTGLRVGCCGTNFVTRHIDGRGNQTLHGYDPQGNRIHTQHRLPSIVEDYEYNVYGQMTAHIHPDNGSGHRRRDEFTYYGAGPQMGYRHQQVIDSTSFAMTTAYEYDAVGNVVREIDARGHDTLYSVNALNQIVRETSREVTDGSGIRYRKDTFYDLNDNVVRIDVENRDEHGILQPNTHFTTRYHYEILNLPILMSQEVDPSRDIVTEYAYDENRNRVLTHHGEAMSGTTLNVLFDERDKVFREIRAQGDSEQSTIQFDYDGNGNTRQVKKGLENSPRITIYVHDGHDRTVRSTDPMGNVNEFHFDPNGNPGGDQISFAPNSFAMRLFGELTDLTGSAANVRLSQTMSHYDAMDREVIRTAEHFDPQTQLAIGDGQSSRQTQYSGTSRVTLVVDDNGHPTQTTYDTANRTLTVIDPRGNSIAYSYDPNSNVIGTIEIDKSDLGNPDQTFTTVNEYDNLDRLIRLTDNMGNVQSHFHDSRGNRVRSVDARGNVTRSVYDGLNRLLSIERVMTDTGNGGGVPVGTIVTTRVWDDPSRVVSEIDDKLNATRDAFDALGRRIVTQKPDGTIEQVGSGATWPMGAPAPNLSLFVSGYDVHDNATKTTDANGSVANSVFDLLDRVTTRGILLGSGVEPPPLGTTSEILRYNGASHLVRLQDNDSEITRRHDSLANVIVETQRVSAAPIQTTTGTFDGEGNLISCVYPGGRVIVRTHDALNHVVLVRDDPPSAGSTIATDYFIGADRLERRDYGNGTRLDVLYDGIRRMLDARLTLISSGSILDQRSFGRDPTSNKVQVSVTAPPPVSTQTYAYDSVSRLVRSQQIPIPPILYSFDGAGNRSSVAGGPDPGAYGCNSTPPEPSDCSVNQYSTTPFDSRSYDTNGNLIDTTSGPYHFAYDYRNRLTRANNTGTGQFTTYRYDGLGRRIEKNVSGVITRYYSLGSSELEEQNSVNATIATYVWGRAVDDLVHAQRASQRFFFHADDLGSTVKVTGTTGSVSEQYTYQDYGKPSFFDANGAPIPSSLIQNDYLFTGHRFDPETSTHFYRSRYLDSRAGRFRTRDPIGGWADPSALGNAFTYVGNNPASFGDPFGTTTVSKDCIKCGVCAALGAICGSTCSGTGPGFPLCFAACWQSAGEGAPSPDDCAEACAKCAQAATTAFFDMFGPGWRGPLVDLVYAPTLFSNASVVAWMEDRARREMANPQGPGPGGAGGGGTAGTTTTGVSAGSSGLPPTGPPGEPTGAHDSGLCCFQYDCIVTTKQWQKDHPGQTFKWYFTYPCPCNSAGYPPRNISTEIQDKEGRKYPVFCDRDNVDFRKGPCSKR